MFLCLYITYIMCHSVMTRITSTVVFIIFESVVLNSQPPSSNRLVKYTIFSSGIYFWRDYVLNWLL